MSYKKINIFEKYLIFISRFGGLFYGKKKGYPTKSCLSRNDGQLSERDNVKVKDGTDVNSIMRDMMFIILEGALDKEMDEEL